MSLFNQLGEFELNQLIARRLTTPGPAPSPTVEPAIFPSLVLESDRPEWGYISGERYAAANAAPAAGGAGFHAYAILINPTGSNTLVTLLWSKVVAAGSSVRYTISNSILAGTPVVCSVADGRWIPSGVVSAQPVALCNVGQLPAAAIEPIIFMVEGSTTAEYDRPIMIRPGQTIVVSCTTANVAISRVSFYWRERTAQPGEL